jgi:hypothetical protein
MVVVVVVRPSVVSKSRSAVILRGGAVPSWSMK